MPLDPSCGPEWCAGYRALPSATAYGRGMEADGVSGNAWQPSSSLLIAH